MFVRKTIRGTHLISASELMKRILMFSQHILWKS